MQKANQGKVLKEKVDMSQIREWLTEMPRASLLTKHLISFEGESYGILLSPQHSSIGGVSTALQSSIVLVPDLPPASMNWADVWCALLRAVPTPDVPVWHALALLDRAVAGSVSAPGAGIFSD